MRLPAFGGPAGVPAAGCLLHAAAPIRRGHSRAPSRSTDMQSGRLAVTSKSSTASPPASVSMPSTANPRTDIVAAISSAVPGTSTNSRSQESEHLHSGELLQEAQVVLVEQPDVVDAVLQHRDALHADAEREPGDLLRVVADGFEHRRVDHAAAENLEPAGVLADAAARAAAALAADVDLRARLGVRKEARAQPHRARRRTARAPSPRSVPFRSASVMPSPTTSPSNCWNIGVWVRSRLSRR